MKKLLIALAITTSPAGVFAQENKLQRSKIHNEKQMKDLVIMKNEIMMIDGKMTILKNGKTKMMAKDIILPNGSVVSPNGIVKMKNGTTIQMREGEMIGMRPNVMKMEK